VESIRATYSETAGNLLQVKSFAASAKNRETCLEKTVFGGKR
jgi:hypothetical protein